MEKYYTLNQLAIDWLFQLLYYDENYFYCMIQLRLITEYWFSLLAPLEICQQIMWWCFMFIYVQYSNVKNLRPYIQAIMYLYFYLQGVQSKKSGWNAISVESKWIVSSNAIGPWMLLKHQPHEQKFRRMRRHAFLQASSWCHMDAPRETIICLRLRCTMKVSNENALTFFCGLILHLLPVNLELAELVSTTYDGCCYY